MIDAILISVTSHEPEDMNCTHVFVTWTLILNIRNLHRQIYTHFLHNIIPVYKNYLLALKHSKFILQKEIKGGLKMQNVEFIYSARLGVTVLQSFSISFVPGHTLALVGSGKS